METIRIKEHLRGLQLALQQNEKVEVTRALARYLSAPIIDHILADIEKVAPPLSPITADQKQAVFDVFVDKHGIADARDLANGVTFGWSEERWAHEYLTLKAAGVIRDAGNDN